MRYRLLLFVLFTAILASAQERGATPNPQSAIRNPQSARAVVVGISDYQSDGIPDLRFADRDATAFAAYLQSSAGGSLPPEHLKLLTNKAATTGAIASAMDWLIADCKRGDRAIIYFSGHGDVETRTRFQRGFLLTYDSPPTNYLAGAFALIFLQDIITTLSEQGVQVIMISDACHAGKLAGSDIGGAQTTAANLSQQFANEIKILSCQPDEFSLEGEQWGGGRGCFSYHLIDGLTGLADGNADKQVNVLELNRYLEEIVPKETAPQTQIPMTVGSKGTVLAEVDETSLLALRQRKATELPLISAIEGKGFEDAFLAGTDSIWRKKYEQFMAALEKGELLEPAGSNAYDLYQELSQVPELERLHGIMKRNLATALQDESQQAINAYLRSDEEELAARSRGEVRYRKFVNYLEKAAELLGEGHYMYRTLKAKQYYFESVDTRVRFRTRTFSLGDSSIIWHSYCQTAMLEALKWEDNAAFIYNELSLLSSGDEQIRYLQKALELAPQWPQLYINYGGWLFGQNQLEKSDSILNIAIQMAPGFSQVYFAFGILYYRQNKLELAETMLKKAIDISPGNVHYLKRLGDFYNDQKRYDEAEKLWLQVLELSPKDNVTYNNLSDFYISKTFKFDKSEALNRKRLEMRPTDGDAYSDLLTTCFYNGQFDKTRKLIANMEIIDSSIQNWEGKMSIGYGYKTLREPLKAILYYQQARTFAPKSPWGPYGLGGAYKMLDDFETFLACLDTSFTNGMSYDWVEFSYQFRQASRSPGFLKFAQNVLANSPETGFGYRLMALYYESREDYPTAMDFYHKATTKSPTVADTWFDYAVCAFLNKEPEKADSLFREVIAVGNPILDFNDIGLFYKNFGDKDRAAQYFMQCIAAKKDWYAAYMNLALLHYSNGEFEKCMEIVQQGLAAVPYSRQLQEMNVTLGYFAYPKDKAKKVFEKAAETQPAFLPLWDFLEQINNKEYEQAIHTWQEFDGQIEAWYLAYLCLGALAQQGDKAVAMDFLKKTTISAMNYQLLTTHPLLEPLQQEPEYKDFIMRHFPERIKD